MIRHTVAFTLNHQSGSLQETEFIEAARSLAQIPKVKKFECLKEIGKKNNFNFGLSMEFDDMDAYEEYNKHPSHQRFVQDHWIPNVSDYIEIDYEL